MAVNEPRNCPVTIHLTKSEKDALTAAASGAGKSVQRFLGDMIRSAPAPEAAKKEVVASK